MVGLNRRFYSVYQQALGILGGRENVTQVSVEWSEDPLRSLELGHPPELLPLLNFANSLHGLDLLPFFGGKVRPSHVWGRNLDPDRRQFRWQMALTGTGQWEAALEFRSNWDVPGRWRLIVDAPGLRLVSAPLESATVLRRGAAPVDIAPSSEDRQFKPGFYEQAARFLNVVDGTGDLSWPACSLGDAAESMRLAADLTLACQQLS